MMQKRFSLTLIAALMTGAFSAAAAQDYGYDRNNDRNDRNNKLDCSSGDGSRNNGLLDVVGGLLGGGRGLNVVGLTDDYRLICFNEKNPGNSRTIGNVAGLGNGDTYLVGIDFRPQDKLLYGVGNNGGVYTLDTNNATATMVTKLTVALDGVSFGVDFNAAANALRITSDTGQNLRLPFATAGAATVVDDPLDYPMGINGVGPNAMGIAGSAYTNVDLDANTSVTLHALDTKLDQVAIQSPANDGTLAATGKLTIDTNAQVGFDNYSTIRNGVTVINQALASLTTDKGNALYSVDLPTGKATLRGKFSSKDQVIGIAIPLNQL